jgi:hypothetical protein
MTDLASADTTSTLDDERRLRVEQLQRRRGARPVADPASIDAAAQRSTRDAPVPPARNRRSRAHPAIGARIGAAGVGLATLFGLVATMTFAQRSTATSVPAPAVAVPAQVVVVIHRTATGASGATAPTAVVPPDRIPSSPIVLTARPTVKVVAPAQSQAAPAARTNGSR